MSTTVLRHQGAGSSPEPPLGAAQAVAAPKVLLHDHLDGGLRPGTVVELAAERGYTALPTTDPDDLAAWYRRHAGRRDLVQYLRTFGHGVAVLQDADALERVAAEAVEDLAADNVVHAEIRFAPELHTDAGLTPAEVVRAVLAGFGRGEAAVARSGGRITVRGLLTAMRTAARSSEIAELVLAFRDEGVVGFDIAGAEAGHPPSRHMEAFDLLRQHHAHITIHAGEAFGLPSIAEAIGWCGAERLGHGVRITDDIEVDADGTVRLGRLADAVRDRRVPLEMCPTSNVDTGAVSSYRDHPVGLLTDLRFRVTVNTDNRLISGVRLSDEFLHLAETFGLGLSAMERLTINAMKSSFVHFDERARVIEELLLPTYAAMRAGARPPAATGEVP